MSVINYTHFLFGVIMQISGYQVYAHELLNYVDPFSRWNTFDR